jgi:hypothetical protein
LSDQRIALDRSVRVVVEQLINLSILIIDFSQQLVNLVIFLLDDDFGFFFTRSDARIPRTLEAIPLR